MRWKTLRTLPEQAWTRPREAKKQFALAKGGIEEAGKGAVGRIKGLFNK